MHFLYDTYKFKIFFLSLLFSCLQVRSALLPDSLLKTTAIIKSFEPNKILNSSPNYSIVFDESGIMFLGQEDKISIYNGVSWSQILLKGEVLLTCNSLNTVFFSVDNILGYLSPDSTQKFKIHSLNSLLPEKLNPDFKIREITSIEKTVYFSLDSSLLSYSAKEFKILDTSFYGGKIFKCRQNLITVNTGNRINVFQEDIRLKSYTFPGAPIKFILEHEEGYLIVTVENKCFIANNSFKVITEWKTLENAILKKGVFLNSDEYVFFDYKNSLLLLGKNGDIKSGFNQLSSIPSSAIIEVVQDKSGNIWILQEKFISRIEYPSSIGIISDLPNGFGDIQDTKSYDNKIFVATTRGLFYFESSYGKFIKTVLTDFCYRLIPTYHGLIALTEDGVFLVHKDICSRIYFGKMLDQSWNPVSHKIYISEPGNIRIFTLEGNHVIDSSKIISPVTPLKILSIDSLLWITDGESLYRYNNLNSSDQKPVKMDIPGPFEISELFNWQGKMHILTTDKIYSNSKGLFYYESSLSNDLCSGEALNIMEDPEGNFWSISRNQDKNSVLWFGNFIEKSLTKIVLPSFISLSNLSVDYTGDQKIILSAGMQIYLLDLKFLTFHAGKFETIIREITAGDKTLFKGISYNFFRVPLRTTLNNIPYNQNDLRVQLSSTNYLDSKVKYQYFLKGSDKTWSEWSSNPYLILQNLKEGQYDLKIRCKDYLNETSEVTSLLFRIGPPFYRTWWAYILYAFACGILLFIAYKTYLLNLHRALNRIPVLDEDPGITNRIPLANGNADSSANNKKFDFFSNIDEDKVKDKTRWDKYEMVTVLFSDIQGFTKIAESMNPELLIDELDRFFFHFDSVVEKYNIEKIKTIGDAYMAAGGIPKKSISNPIEVVLAALEMQNYMKQLKKTKIDIWDLRIGIHSGPVIAGIIGHKKRSFDIWGDTVNTASRMESTGEAGKVNISSETYKFVKDYFICEYRGKLPVKYKGNIDMYFVKGLRPELSINLVGLPNRKFFLKLQILRLTDLEELVFPKLEAELHRNLYFHNSEYARHIYEHSELLAKAADLDLEEILLIRTAALLLNVGFTGGYENQENRSAEYARNILPEYNYSEKQIAVISNLILSSKWPPEPVNMMEMVLYDTKMEFIGRADYIRLYKLLFLEQNQYTKSIDVNEFKRKQLEIIQQYLFFTESARRLREISVKDQISRIKEDDWK
jgi:adenylate cyclase